jgi:uncharacterized cupin superfamily protein
MKKPVMNISDVDLRPMPAGLPPELEGTYGGSRMGQIGMHIGAQKLGYNVTAVPPGRRAFPFHSHRANEEMFFVLEGSGEVRIGAERHPIKQGDVVACPPGGPETAHQIVNTGTSELRYLAVSTKIAPEVAEYPDSKKVGVLVDPTFRFLMRAGESAGYWDGEPPV